jgi:hypothetical protein
VSAVSSSSNAMVREKEDLGSRSRAELEEEVLRSRENRSMDYEVRNPRGRIMPAQKPGKSFQAYATPRDFLDAVKSKFGVKVWAWDLAATVENAVAEHFFGDPDLSRVSIRCDALDSLKQDWTRLRGDLWLNCPYADIEPWAEKCATSAAWPKQLLVQTAHPFARRIFLLVPASVGSNWWADHVHERARVIFPRPRLSFDGVAPYPKDLGLILYGEKPGYETWRWRP